MGGDRYNPAHKGAGLRTKRFHFSECRPFMGGDRHNRRIKAPDSESCFDLLDCRPGDILLWSFALHLQRWRPIVQNPARAPGIPVFFSFRHFVVDILQKIEYYVSNYSILNKRPEIDC